MIDDSKIAKDDANGVGSARKSGQRKVFKTGGRK